MEFGLFCNNRRPERSLGHAWDEDIFEVVMADRLGFHEAWMSEHQAPAELILCKAAGLTKQIRLGSAVRPVAYYHPLQVALEANATDQLTGGRYMLGVGFGFYPKNMEWRGLDFTKTRDMMHASVELMLKLWHSGGEPVDYEGPFWSGKQMILQAEPVQKPHPPIAVACANSHSTAELAGAKGFIMLTNDFIAPKRMRGFAEAMVEAARKAGRPPCRKNIRACRVIYVAETDKEARDIFRDNYNRVIKWEIVNTPHHQTERIPPGGTLEDITFDYLCDTGNLFVGSPETVTRAIESYYEQTGGFGTMLFHAGRDYTTREQWARSATLFMEEVAPRVRHLDPDTPAPARSVDAALASTAA
jgi:alkanesulfonate monooxygenase SsuD/methylene tetrahydromethanopterin reductase-like flavin-dependent oxidoreductase (luciferase family)